MSASETDSEPEPELTTDAVSSLTTFAHLSATRTNHTPAGQGSVSWAVDTLATLDFRLVRKDTALHGLIRDCASAILALFNAVLQQEPAVDSTCNFIPDVTSILRPSFLHLLFQYRRLFRVIATRDFKPGSALLATVCWVDVVLARLGDVAALIAAGLDEDPDRSLPKSLKAQREEDNLRAAIQLPDTWDMLPSMLLSERVSIAAKRLSIRLMVARYILYPALSGQVGVENTTHKLLSTFAEFVRQSAARVDGLRSVSEPGLRYLMLQERFTSAMAISLFVAADIAQGSTIDPEHAVAFRPNTVAAAMRLLRFVLNEGEYPTQANILGSLDHLDVPRNVIVRWGVVPCWAWSIWPEHRVLHADTIMCLTTACIRHCGAGLFHVSDLMPTESRTGNQAAMISVTIDLLSRFISVLFVGGHSKQLPTGMISVLHGSCYLISQWMNRNSCGIRNSEECCRTLIILFGYLSQGEQYSALNELVIECLVLVGEECVRKAWKAAAQDGHYCFLEVLGQNLIQTKTMLSQDDQSRDIHAAQLMQFLVVMMFKGVRPLSPDSFTELMDVVGERVLEMPLNNRGFLCETFLTCIAIANLSGIDFPFCKVNAAADDEVMWRLGMCRGDVNLFLASAFSLYITSAIVKVEPLTYLEGLEYLLDMALLICSRQYPREDEPLALIVLPTICDALAHLLEHRDDTIRMYTGVNGRISALGGVLRSLVSAEECDGFDALLKRRLSSTARRVLLEMNEPLGVEREHALVFCRVDRVTSHHGSEQDYSSSPSSSSSSSLSMSSSFALSCRRRSHSASSPSPSPAPASSWRPAHKRAHSSHRDTPTFPDSQRCHLDIWRTGKRLRRDPSATRSSTPASADSRTASSSSSAPHTPLFPVSSAEFLLLPNHLLCGGNLSNRNPRVPSSAVPFLHDDTCESSESQLARLRSAAFSELHRSVEENGEGFVKRMREFEDSRSRSAQHSRARGIERRRRKRYSPSVPTPGTTGKSFVSDDDDVLILSSALDAQPFHSRQKRSSSLGAMDDSDFQSHAKTNPSGRLSPISSIFHPIPFVHNASHVQPNTSNWSSDLSTSFSTSFDFTSSFHTNAFKSTLSQSSSDSLASMVAVSSSTSYAEDANYPSSSPPQSPCHLLSGAKLTSASSADKAIAALTLAMANGAGSLGDYEAVRTLNVSSADESQVGELWH